MKLVIYRDKKTNQIVNFHEVYKNCTDEAIKAYNDDEKVPDRAEIVDLEEDSLAYYFYTMKTKQIQDEAEDLRELMDDLTDISNRIDDRLYDFDRWFKSEKGERDD